MISGKLDLWPEVSDEVNGPVMKVLPRTRSCFVCGTTNPIGLALEFHTDGQVVSARFCPRPDHVGFQGVVHGGLLSTVLDEAMVWACSVQAGRFVYCAELTVRFLHPVAPGRELEIRGELVTNRRDRLFLTKGELRDSDVVYATATGKYLPVPDEALEPMRGDFLGDLDAFLRRPGTTGGGNGEGT